MTIFFRDYSQYNGVVSDPYPIRIARASIGREKDTAYDANKAKAVQENQFFVGYHFLNHDVLDNIEAQADFAYSVVGHDTPLMLDWESNRGYLPPLSQAQRFINRYRSNGGTVRRYYTPHWFWSAIGSPNLSWFQSNGVSLVSSNYTTYSDNGPGWNGYGGVVPDQWQFTSTPYDLNAFRGTVAQYIAATGLINPSPFGDDVPTVQLDMNRTTAVLESPTMTGGSAWLTLSCAFETGPIGVRVALWDETINGYRHADISGTDYLVYVSAAQGPIRVQHFTGLQVTKAELALPTGYNNTLGVFTASIIPDRPYS